MKNETIVSYSAKIIKALQTENLDLYVEGMLTREEFDSVIVPHSYAQYKDRFGIHFRKTLKELKANHIDIQTLDFETNIHNMFKPKQDKVKVCNIIISGKTKTHSVEFHEFVIELENGILKLEGSIKLYYFGLFPITYNAEEVDNYNYVNYLEFEDEKSHKYWGVIVVDRVMSVHYGKKNTAGRTTTKSFETVQKAELAAQKSVQQKVKKGYNIAERPLEGNTFSSINDVLKHHVKALKKITGENDNYITLKGRKKVKPEAIALTEEKLGITIPEVLKEWYVQHKNGVGESEQFEILGHQNILGLIDGLKEFTEGDVDVMGDAEYSGNTKLLSDLKRINDTYFIFAVSWLDFQFMDFLFFDTAHNFYDFEYSHEHHLVMYDDYLKNIAKDYTKHKNFPKFLNTFLEQAIEKSGYDDYE